MASTQGTCDPKTEDRRQKAVPGPVAWRRAAVAATVLSPVMNGAVAQLGEHLLCKQGVVGSIPISSTST